ncbi:MAG: TolC family protein [Planctomycetota bacterium]|nr:TolC family protein [Planctomycetota bacterium]
MKKTFLILSLMVLTVGCSENWARRDADQQVQKLLSERKDQTLGYQPQTEVRQKTSAAALAPAYSVIPQTPIAPPTVPSIEPADQMVPRTPLGPSRPSVGLSLTTRPSVIGVEAAERNAAERLTLGPPNPAEKPIRFDLYKSLAYAVQHSRDYEDRCESVYLAALQVTLQRHLFDASPFMNETVTATGGQRDVNYQSAMTALTTAGVRQNLPYGGSVTAEGLVTFVQALNDHTQNGESAQLVLNGSVPLLRGAGMVNLEPLISTERNLVYTIRSFEDFRRNFSINLASQYFQIRIAQQSINDRRQNYITLANLTDRTQALYDAGRVTYLDVQRALQAQLGAENELINAQQNYESQLDQFKLLLGMEVGQKLDIVPVDLAVSEPDLDNQDVVGLAMKYRLDLQTSRDQLDDARRQVADAANGLLPDLNLTAQAQVGNETIAPASRINDRTATYSAGLTFGLPLDRVAERNAYRAALIQLERARRDYVNTQQAIIADMRGIIRTIHSAESTLEIDRLGIALAEQRVEYSNELLAQGKAGALDVVDAQQSLLSAEDSFEQARANLQIQDLQFLRTTGTLRIDPAAGSLGQAMDRAMDHSPMGLEAK